MLSCRGPARPGFCDTGLGEEGAAYSTWQQKQCWIGDGHAESGQGSVVAVRCRSRTRFAAWSCESRKSLHCAQIKGGGPSCIMRAGTISLGQNHFHRHVSACFVINMHSKAPKGPCQNISGAELTKAPLVRPPPLGSEKKCSDGLSLAAASCSPGRLKPLPHPSKNRICGWA